MDWVILIFNFWHTLASLFGCCVNVLLIYLCIYRSPKSIQTYGIFIINFAITDFIECLFDIFLEFRIIPIPNEAKLVYQFNGLCQFFGQKICIEGLSVFLHCVPHGLWSLLLSFSYRFYILNHPGLSKKQIIVTLCIVYIPSFIQLISFSQNFWDNQKTIDLVHEKLPSYNLTGLIAGTMDIFRSPSALFGLAHICIPIYPIYITIFILRRKIIKVLTESENMLSVETKAVHSQMLKCLTYQSLIPVFMVIGVCLYFVAQFGIMNNRYIELGIMSTYLPMPVLSSLTYLIFVRPYREYCRRVFQSIIISKVHHNPTHTPAFTTSC